MYKKLKIKLFKVKATSPNAEIKMIVVGFNNKVNGSYKERIGVFYAEHEVRVIMINVRRLSYWLRRGGIKIKPKVAEAIGLLGEAEYKAFYLDKDTKF